MDSFLMFETDSNACICLLLGVCVPHLRFSFLLGFVELSLMIKLVKKPFLDRFTSYEATVKVLPKRSPKRALQTLQRKAANDAFFYSRQLTILFNKVLNFCYSLAIGCIQYFDTLRFSTSMQ